MGTYSKERLIKLLNLTASDNDNEALLALRNAQKVMKLAELTWESLVTTCGSAASHRQSSAPSPKQSPMRSSRKAQMETPPEPKGKAARAIFRRNLSLFEFIFAQELGIKQVEFFEGLRSAWVRFGSLTVKQQAALERTCVAKGFRG
jgi:hypothetical protein